VTVTPAALSHAELADAFRAQARGCSLTGSPIYAALLDRAAEDVARGGLFADLVSTYRGVPMLDALPLRVLGAVHALVLGGRAPGLAAFYPSTGGHFEAEGAFQALCEVCDAHRDELRDAAATLRVQTNEVQRSAVLVPGFLRVAARTGLPLRIREIGSSAGLNLFFDRHRYELGPHRFGDAASALVLAARWNGAPPDLEATLRVASRRGCDVAPLDVRDPAHRLRLESFVWPEQLDRLARLRAALAVAMREPPEIDAEPAGAWLESQLGEPAEGVATVLFHSVVWWYIPEAERARITRAMESASARATRAAPLAWLRMEGLRLEEAELRLRLWPDGEDALLARVHWHGAEVRWLG
jgi:hypothetical protein